MCVRGEVVMQLRVEGAQMRDMGGEEETAAVWLCVCEEGRHVVSVSVEAAASGLKMKRKDEDGGPEIKSDEEGCIEKK